MDEGDGDFLDKLAAEIADGDPIDWDSIGRLPADDPRQRLLQHLRVVAAIAEQHRSAVDGAPDEVATVWGPDQAGRLFVRPSPHHAEADAGGLGQWGNLLLRRKIGEGAFGEVFHAHDLWLDHPVALKLLRPEIAQSDFSGRILHEARRLARVRHPNVVNVHGADMHDGRIGFWMDLIEGETLAEILSRGRLSPGEAALVGQEICLALAAVHGANLIHRDVKAQNVMRASNTGRIILMDFGAGEFLDRPSAGSMRGTPLYLAPELFDGAHASVATDIYASGVLLYHLVTSRFPVSGPTIDRLADSHKRGERRRLRDERPDLPDSFVSVIERAIDPDPQRRFASAGEMYEALGGEDERKNAGARRLTTRQKLTRAGLGVAGALLITEALGMLASRAFESTLRVDPAFAAGLADYFDVGRRALIPFVMVWTAAAAGAAVLTGLYHVIWPHLGPVRRRLTALAERVDPTVPAAVVVAVGAAGFLALIWQFYGVYYAATALAIDPRPEALDLSILGWPGRDLHRDHAMVCVGLSFLLGWAAWRWFPRLEKRAADPERVRKLRWAALVVALLLVAEETATRPLLWDRREIVSFENQLAFVIGTRSDELLLYTPAKGERKWLRVRVDAPGLRRNVGARALFLESDNP
jgi:tRNA A-37 threonylcarbamoyl transferase component Bud32